MAANLRALIEQGSARLELELSAKQLEQLVAYVKLLAKWNKVYNLTSIRDNDEMVTRHLLDSLAIVPYLTGQTLLDVGSGGGLPGIPIAISKPELAVTLLDSNSKKTRFLQQAKAELDLTNVTVIHGRTEQLQLPPFSIVTARAFSTLESLVELAGSHCAEKGKMLLMKGVYPEKELDFDIAQYGFQLKNVTPLQVPGYDAQRHLVELVRI